MKPSALKVYLSHEIADQVRRHATATGRSGSSVVAEAVRARFDEGQGRAEALTAKRLLHRLDRRLDRVVRDQSLMKESLLVFVRVWLEHNPPLDEALEISAAQSAAARFERFCDLVVFGLRDQQSAAAPLFAAATAADEDGRHDGNAHEAEAMA